MAITRQNAKRREPVTRQTTRGKGINVHTAIEPSLHAKERTKSTKSANSNSKSKIKAVTRAKPRDLFSTLPTELRAAIYKLLLPRSAVIKLLFSQASPTPTFKCIIGSFPKEEWIDTTTETVAFRQGIQDTMHLMLVNRLARAEIQPLLYGNRNFCFPHTEDFEWFQSILTVSTKRLIKSLNAPLLDAEDQMQRTTRLRNVFEDFPNLTQLGLYECDRSNNELLYGTAWQPGDLEAFVLIQKLSPRLSVACCLEMTPFDWVRFINEKDEPDFGEYCHLEHGAWEEVAFDVDEEMQALKKSTRELKRLEDGRGRGKMRRK
jgi:hypothetical protein